MKKLFAIVAVMGVLTFGSTQLAQAQDAPAAEQTEQQAAPAAEEPAEETVTETTAPQTFDVTVIASAAAIVSLAGFAATRKKS